MKKIIALVLTLVFCLFALAACGGDNGDEVSKNDSEVTSSDLDSVSSEDTSSEDDSSEEVSSEEKKLELKNDGQYVVCCLSKNKITINSTDDFKNYSVAYVDETDGMRYAEYYDFKETLMYNAPHDARSGITGGACDLVIFDKSILTSFTEFEVVWDFNQ